jgi:predicted metal-dependent phosphotriesterase family hydrolase
MADYDEAGRLIISRARQLEQIPEICYSCNSDDLKMIMTLVDGGSWICLDCNALNCYEPSMRLTKNMSYSMLNLGADEIIFVPEWDFE